MEAAAAYEAQARVAANRAVQHVFCMVARLPGLYMFELWYNIVYKM
jgi:hypothetical protein